MSEVYISVDIETDGKIPGRNSMLSLGAAAFQNGKLSRTFGINLETLPNAVADQDTMEWWATQPEAWNAHRKDVVSPEIGMKQFIEWVEACGSKPVFVGYPAGFDFTFVYWYMIYFVGRSPFSFSALDIKSYAMAKLGLSYRETVKRNMPKEWFPKTKHNHVAVDDAIEQGYLFINMLKEQTK